MHLGAKLGVGLVKAGCSLIGFRVNPCVALFQVFGLIDFALICSVQKKLVVPPEAAGWRAFLCFSGILRCLSISWWCSARCPCWVSQVAPSARRMARLLRGGCFVHSPQAVARRSLSFLSFPLSSLLLCSLSPYKPCAYDAQGSPTSSALPSGHFVCGYVGLLTRWQCRIRPGGIFITPRHTRE